MVVVQETCGAAAKQGWDPLKAAPHPGRLEANQMTAQTSWTYLFEFLEKYSSSLLRLHAEDP